MTPNPNRKLTAEQVVSQLSARLPHHAPNLVPDRRWLWLVTDGKPCEEDRAVLKDLGFSFTPRPHPLADGREGRWFHACRRNDTGDAEQKDDSLAALMALAET